MENCHSLKCGIWAKSRGARRGSVDRGGASWAGWGREGLIATWPGAASPAGSPPLG